MDLEKPDYPEEVKKLRAAVASADAFIFACPEVRGPALSRPLETENARRTRSITSGLLRC